MVEKFMLLRKIIFSIIVPKLLFVGLNAKGQDTLQPFLHYVNKNQSIDFMAFYNSGYKIVYGKQRSPGPIPVYLMNGHNLITDTLPFKVLPEFLLFDKASNVYIIGPDAFHHVKISADTLRPISSYTASDYRNIHRNLWRVVKLENRIIGLLGSGIRTSVVAVQNTDGKILTLIPYRKEGKFLAEQRQVNISYSYTPGQLFVFIVPYQSLFRIRLSDLSVSETVLPSFDAKSAWYHFFDHLHEQHYFVKEHNQTFMLYAMQNNRLYELMPLKVFPMAIIESKLHFVTESDEGRHHYLVPISIIDRVNTSANFLLLDEVEIKCRRFSN